jgi:hypothetical protein
MNLGTHELHILAEPERAKRNPSGRRVCRPVPECVLVGQDPHSAFMDQGTYQGKMAKNGGPITVLQHHSCNLGASVQPRQPLSLGALALRH